MIFIYYDMMLIQYGLTNVEAGAKGTVLLTTPFGKSTISNRCWPRTGTGPMPLMPTPTTGVKGTVLLTNLVNVSTTSKSHLEKQPHAVYAE